MKKFSNITRISILLNIMLLILLLLSHADKKINILTQDNWVAILVTIPTIFLNIFLIINNSQTEKNNRELQIKVFEKELNAQILDKILNIYIELIEIERILNLNEIEKIIEPDIKYIQMNKYNKDLYKMEFYDEISKYKDQLKLQKRLVPFLLNKNNLNSEIFDTNINYLNDLFNLTNQYLTYILQFIIILKNRDKNKYESFNENVSIIQSNIKNPGNIKNLYNTNFQEQIVKITKTKDQLKKIFDVQKIEDIFKNHIDLKLK